MISRAQVKRIRSLHQKKYRDEYGLFIAEGPKVVMDLLHSRFKAEELFATEEFVLRNNSLSASVVSEKELENISAQSTPNQVVGVFAIPSGSADLKLLRNKLVLGVDDIRDPGNLGAIIRIADWFGISDLLCSENCVDTYNPKTVQAAMGSLARVAVHTVNLKQALAGFGKVYGAVMSGKSIYEENLSSSGLILIGNESRGLSEEILECVTDRISIPGFSNGADSLNAAMAAAVICSEFRRRK